MISLCTAILRELIRLYTYPYRKRHMSLSRSVKLKSGGFNPPRGLAVRTEMLGGVRTEVTYNPRAEKEGGNIIHFHGGGHTAAMSNMYRKVACIYAKMCNCTVYSIDYTVGEELVYPAVHEQCFAAYRAIVETLKGGFVTAGDSFGANLMLYCLLKARDGGLPMPRGAVCVSPYADMAASGESYRLNCKNDPMYALTRGQKFEDFEEKLRRISPYCGNTPLNDPYLSPAYADFYGLPEILIVGGGAETSASDCEMICARAAEAGTGARYIKCEGMWHDFLYMFPKLKESREAWSEIKKFICGHTSAPV